MKTKYIITITEETTDIDNVSSFQVPKKAGEKIADIAIAEGKEVY